MKRLFSPPIRGLFFMTCDYDFAIVQLKIRREDWMYRYKEYTTYIEKSSDSI
jgi:hypothetical protein